MNELEELRIKIEQQDYAAALRIVDDLEEMSREDKINKIYSYSVILLLHLIKQVAEKRTTSSWNRSIKNSTDRILRTNKRRKSGGFYAKNEELKEILLEAYPEALSEAAYEAFEGKYSDREIAELVDRSAVLAQAFDFISNR